MLLYFCMLNHYFLGLHSDLRFYFEKKMEAYIIGHLNSLDHLNELTYFYATALVLT